MARSIAAATGSSTRNRAVLMLAAVFGVLSAGLVLLFLSGSGGGSDISKSFSPADGAESVVVVTRNIGVGEKITADMLTTKTLPKSLVLPGGATRAEDLVGKVATAPMFEGEQALNAKATTFGGQNTLAYKIPDGMRAVSVQVPHEAWIAAGLIQPGDRVDVLAITTLMKTDPLTGEEKPNTNATIFAQDVEVLAMAQSLVKVVPNLDAKKATDTTAGATPAAGVSPTTSEAVIGSDPLKDAATYEKAISVTLAVPPDLAAGIALIDQMKKDVAAWRLLPRQKGDSSKLTGTTTWTLDDVMSPKKK